MLGIGKWLDYGHFHRGGGFGWQLLSRPGEVDLDLGEELFSSEVQKRLLKKLLGTLVLTSYLGH